MRSLTKRRALFIYNNLAIMKKQRSHAPVPKGKLIIIGGAEDKSAKQSAEVHQDILKEFVKLCGKNAVIEIITTAGEEAVDDTYAEYSKCFINWGASGTGHIHHQERIGIEEPIMERVKKAHGIFFSGGDQLKLTAIYGGSELMSVLKQRYINEKIIIGGTSAGAMAMSTPMIFDGSGQIEMVAAEVKVTTGFEFLKDVCIDTHFVHRGRFVRMAQVIATNPASIGIGIEENTAIVITQGIKAEVIGSGVVIIIDGKNSHGSNITGFDKSKKITIRDLQVSILSNQQLFEIPAPNPPHL